MDRRIRFEGIMNCRDLGGLVNREGMTIRTGCLIRSANLAGTSYGDIDRLREMRLRKVIDLRTAGERAERPDIAVEGSEYVPLSILDESTAGISHEESDREKILREVPAMERLYRNIISRDEIRKNLAEAVRMIMEHDFEEGCVLWHCTEGKDRCGLTAFSLLAALDVPRETITEDYLITNETNEPKAGMYYRMLEPVYGKEEAQRVSDLFLAKESYLNAAYEEIDSRWGDDLTFVREGLGIPDEVIAAFRKKMLR